MEQPQTPQEPTQDEAAQPQEAQAQPEQAAQPDMSGEADALASLAAAMSQAQQSGIEMQDNSSEQHARIAELEQENAALRDRALRASAEVENMRRRSEREQSETAKYALTGFTRDLLTVYENLARASQSIPEEARKSSDQMNNLAIGVDMTLQEMQNVFGKHHIKRIDPTGQPFDHNLHQAMTKVETAEHAEGTVMQVMQAAYTIHDRLLQPAMVVVATAPKDAQTPQDPSAGEPPHHVDQEV